jgi:hypothetical protein
MTAISIIAAQAPLDIFQHLRFLRVRVMGIEEPSQRLQHRVLLALDPAGLDQPLQLLVQLIRTLDGDAFHKFKLSMKNDVRKIRDVVKPSGEAASNELVKSSFILKPAVQTAKHEKDRS